MLQRSHNIVAIWCRPESRSFSWRRAKPKAKNIRTSGGRRTRSVEDTCVRSQSPLPDRSCTRTQQAQFCNPTGESTRTSEESCVCFACPLGWHLSAWLPHKLVHRSSPPPTEGVQEIQQSGLLHQIRRPMKGRLKLYLDGNTNWDTAAAAEGLHWIAPDHVVHKDKELCRKNGKRHLDSGTMSIDARWRSLDNFLPSGMNARSRDRQVNPWVKVLTYSWLCRHNSKERAPRAVRQIIKKRTRFVLQEDQEIGEKRKCIQDTVVVTKQGQRT